MPAFLCEPLSQALRRPKRPRERRDRVHLPGHGTSRPEHERGRARTQDQRAHEPVTLILNGRRAITGDTALRLAHFFGTTAELWLTLQSLHDLRVAEAKTGKVIRQLPALKRQR